MTETKLPGTKRSRHLAKAGKVQLICYVTTRLRTRLAKAAKKAVQSRNNYMTAKLEEALNEDGV